MGSQTSSLMKEYDRGFPTVEILKPVFKDFVGMYCEFDPKSHVYFNELASAFYTFLYNRHLKLQMPLDNILRIMKFLALEYNQLQPGGLQLSSNPPVDMGYVVGLKLKSLPVYDEAYDAVKPRVIDSMYDRVPIVDNSV